MARIAYISTARFIYGLLSSMGKGSVGMQDDLLLDSNLPVYELDRLYNHIERHFGLPQPIPFSPQSNTVRNLVIFISNQTGGHATTWMPQNKVICQ